MDFKEFLNKNKIGKIKDDGKFVEGNTSIISNWNVKKTIYMVRQCEYERIKHLYFYLQNFNVNEVLLYNELSSDLELKDYFKIIKSLPDPIWQLEELKLEGPKYTLGRLEAQRRYLSIKEVNSLSYDDIQLFKDYKRYCKNVKLKSSGLDR